MMLHFEAVIGKVVLNLSTFLLCVNDPSDTGLEVNFLVHLQSFASNNFFH